MFLLQRYMSSFNNTVRYQSIPSLTILPPPRATPGDSHILSTCPWSRVFAPPSCPGVLNQSKSSIILRKKNAIFGLSLKQMDSSSFYKLIYAKSEQCDVGPIYTITNTQHIRIYPGKLKFILVKIITGSRTFTWQTCQRKPNSVHVFYH